jgi:hypothetical protein
MSLRLVHGLSAQRTFVIALLMALVMALIGYAGQPRMEDARVAAPLFTEATRLVERPTGPRYDLAVAEWIGKARGQIARYVDLHGGPTTRNMVAALTTPRQKARLAHAGFTYGPALGELELGTVFIGRSIRTALRPAPLAAGVGQEMAVSAAPRQP